MKAFTRLAVLPLIFFAVLAHAGQDIILQPGQARSVWIDSPQVVNVACIGAPTPPPAAYMAFNEVVGTVDAPVCQEAAAAFSDFRPAEGIVGSLTGVCEPVEGGGYRLVAKAWGLAVGQQMDFSIPLSVLQSTGCSAWIQRYQRMRGLASEDGAMSFDFRCDTDRRFRVRVTRYR